MPQNIDWKALSEKSIRLTEEYATELGKAVAAWNLLQDGLGRLFAEIVGPTNHRMARLIWYSQDSDINQQKMLKAAAEGAYGTDSELYKCIDWLCTEAGKLAQERNNAVHVHHTLWFDDTQEKLAFSPSGEDAWHRARAMSKRDLFATLKVLGTNAKALFSYGAELAPIIAFPEQFPEPKPGLPHSWPDKPVPLKFPARPKP